MEYLIYKLKHFIWLFLAVLVVSFAFFISGFTLHVTSYKLHVIRYTLAAQLSFSPAIQELGINQQFQLDLVLDTQDEEINALEGELAFPLDLLVVQEIRKMDTIISLWLEEPTIKQQETGDRQQETSNKGQGKIRFAGIIPGGYNEKQGKIFSVIFQAEQLGQGNIEIKDSRVLLNDGQGSAAALSILNLPISIITEPQLLPNILEIKDQEPPEIFQPIIGQEPTMFENKYFLVFMTQDKGAGIDYYEVKETRNKRRGIEGGGWARTESPYVLKDQKLRSYIFVRAVDKAGNERLVMLPPQQFKRWYENWWIWGIIGGTAVLIGITIWLVRWLLKAGKRKSCNV